ncbi:MAG: hypothetical protein CM1200mP34_3820 [Verrucomicrobiales bacterium]|nr:MAG: hypothetical protein CM1200mP34_3820 [Verrucomicrobiales bacterium]
MSNRQSAGMLSSAKRDFLKEQPFLLQQDGEL